MHRLPPDVIALLDKAAISKDPEAAVSVLIERLKTLPDWEQLQDVFRSYAPRNKVEEALVAQLSRGHRPSA
jgi:hypothetical protein